MTFLEKILGIISAVGFFFNVVFFVLFKLKREEQKILKNELDYTQTELKRIKDENEQNKKSGEIYKKTKEENADLLQRASSGNNNAGLDLLQKLADKGKSRRNK